jgi:threonine dehydrogenase-like Zn-dependent dehydrogenase
VKALTVRPGVEGSGALREVDEPAAADGDVLVQTLAVGVCGTDLEILKGAYGAAPPGDEFLVLGHESLGQVLEAPTGSGLAAGDLVVGIVRQPDPVPCSACAVGEWDMCLNGQFTEHGIKGLHGFARERYRIPAEYVVKVDPALGRLGVLLEPASVVAKAWDHIERIGNRAAWAPRTVLVTGAGPIGLLSALLAVQRGFEVHVLDLATTGPKPELVRQLGATYHAAGLPEIGVWPDITVEATGVPALVLDLMGWNARSGITCLTGVSEGGTDQSVDAGALNRAMVLENDVVFGSVNANRRHYEAGAAALAQADPDWLAGLVTRQVPLAQFETALERRADDVKVVLDLR